MGRRVLAALTQAEASAVVYALGYQLEFLTDPTMGDHITPTQAAAMRRAREKLDAARSSEPRRTRTGAK